MTFRLLKACTKNATVEMRYRKLATNLTATKRSPTVKEFTFFAAVNCNRRIFSRIA